MVPNLKVPGASESAPDGKEKVVVPQKETPPPQLAMPSQKMLSEQQTPVVSAVPETPMAAATPNQPETPQPPQNLSFEEREVRAGEEIVKERREVREYGDLVEKLNQLSVE